MILQGISEGRDISIKIIHKLPNKFYQELDFTVGKQLKIFDGKKGRMEVMGQYQELAGKQFTELKKQANLFPFLDYFSDNYKLELKGIETIDGNDSYQIDIESPNGIISSEYYDINSGYKEREVKKVTTSNGSFEQTVDLKDYIVIDGIKTPSTIIQKIGTSIIELKLKSIEYNTDIDDSLFEIN